MSAALAGTKAAAAMKPAAGKLVQYLAVPCFTGSLHVGGQRRRRARMAHRAAFAPIARAAAVDLKRTRLGFGRRFLFVVAEEVPKSRPVLVIACHRSIKLG